MNSTVETFMSREQSSFKKVSEYVLAHIEEALFRSIAECLKRQLDAGNETATLVMPWGTYTTTYHNGANGGNINSELEFSKDFMAAINDEKNQKAIYLEDFDPEFTTLFSNYCMCGNFEADEKKLSSPNDKGVRLDDFQKEYFPNAYGMMIVCAGREHRAPGEMYQIKLCDTVPHGVIEFDYGSDDNTTVKFTFDKSFKQYLKDDASSDE